MSMRRERPGQRALRPELDDAVEQSVVDDGMVERVGADQHGRHVARDDAEGSRPPCMGEASPYPTTPSVVDDAHERGAAARRIARRPD